MFGEKNVKKKLKESVQKREEKVSQKVQKSEPMIYNAERSVSRQMFAEKRSAVKI